MRRAARLAFALALRLGAVVGCAPDPGAAYAKAFAEGQRAMGSGRYDEASAAFSRAAAEAQRLKDRDEALFLVARAREDARDYAGAKKAFADVIATSPDGPRTVRARYALAYLDIEHGDAEAGFAALQKALFLHPNHGSADRALLELADRAEERGGAAARAKFLEEAESRLRDTELHEQASYRLGLSLEALGRKEEAKERLVRTAEAHPHPYGGLADDSYWHAARLARELGRPEEALSLLRRLLAPQERSTMNGSYIRRRFPPALLQIAVILRDDLKDMAGARNVLLELPSRFPDSILRDDALWEAARLARLAGDEGGACDATGELVDEVPDSRFGPCVTLLCPRQKPVGDRPCADYVAQDLAEGRGATVPGE